MKIKTRYILIIGTLFLTMGVLSGCLTPSLIPQTGDVPQHYIANTNTQTMLDTAQQYVGLLPPPYNSVASAGLMVWGLAGTAFAAYMNERNKKTGTQLSSVIAAVQTLNHPPATQAVQNGLNAANNQPIQNKT